MHSQRAEFDFMLPYLEARKQGSTDCELVVSGEEQLLMSGLKKGTKC